MGKEIGRICLACGKPLKEEEYVICKTCVDSVSINREDQKCGRCGMSPCRRNH